MVAAVTPGGWRRTGERPITYLEIGEITLLQRKAHRRAILAGVCVPLSFLLWIAAMATAFEMSRYSVGNWIFLPSLLMALCFLWMLDTARHAVGLRKDLKRGTVVCYEGRLNWLESATDVECRMFSDGLLRRDAAAPQVLEILPEARMVWRVDGVAPPKLIFETERIRLSTTGDETIG